MVGQVEGDVTLRGDAACQSTRREVNCGHVKLSGGEAARLSVTLPSVAGFAQATCSGCGPRK